MSKLAEQMQKLALHTQEADRLGLTYGQYMILRETSALPDLHTQNPIQNHYYKHGAKRKGGGGYVQL